MGCFMPRSGSTRRATARCVPSSPSPTTTTSRPSALEAARPGEHPPRDPRRGADRSRAHRPPRGAFPGRRSPPHCPARRRRYSTRPLGARRRREHCRPGPSATRSVAAAVTWHGAGGDSCRRDRERAFPSAAIGPRRSSARPASTGLPFWEAATRIFPARSAVTPRCSRRDGRGPSPRATRSPHAGRCVATPGPDPRQRLRHAITLFVALACPRIPGVPAMRTVLLRRARAAAQRGRRRKHVDSVRRDRTGQEVQVS